MGAGRGRVRDGGVKGWSSIFSSLYIGEGVFILSFNLCIYFFVRLFFFFFFFFIYLLAVKKEKNENDNR